MLSLAVIVILMGSHSPTSAGLLDSALILRLDSSCFISALTSGCIALNSPLLL